MMFRSSMALLVGFSFFVEQAAYAVDMACGAEAIPALASTAAVNQTCAICSTGLGKAIAACNAANKSAAVGAGAVAPVDGAALGSGLPSLTTSLVATTGSTGGHCAAKADLASTATVCGSCAAAAKIYPQMVTLYNNNCLAAGDAAQKLSQTQKAAQSLKETGKGITDWMKANPIKTAIGAAVIGAGLMSLLNKDKKDEGLAGNGNSSAIPSIPEPPASPTPTVPGSSSSGGPAVTQTTDNPTNSNVQLMPLISSSSSSDQAVNVASLTPGTAPPTTFTDGSTSSASISTPGSLTPGGGNPTSPALANAESGDTPTNAASGGIPGAGTANVGLAGNTGRALSDGGAAGAAFDFGGAASAGSDSAPGTMLVGTPGGSRTTRRLATPRRRTVAPQVIARPATTPQRRATQSTVRAPASTTPTNNNPLVDRNSLLRSMQQRGLIGVPRNR